MWFWVKDIEAMKADTELQQNEKSITKRQYLAFAIGMVLFIPATLISTNVFRTPKYGMLAPVATIIYIAISSMTNQISILRARGRREPSRGKQALTYGVILLGVAIFAVISIFVPSLSKIFFPF